MLSIKDLHAEIDQKSILKGINLEIKPGEMHAIMGRNGSGKSTLSNVITGRENYSATKGSLELNNESILDWTPEKRSLEGIFMSFQYPVVIPGVNNTYFLKAALIQFSIYVGRLTVIGNLEEMEIAIVSFCYCKERNNYHGHWCHFLNSTSQSPIF